MGGPPDRTRTEEIGQEGLGSRVCLSMRAKVAAGGVLFFSLMVVMAGAGVVNVVSAMGTLMGTPSTRGAVVFPDPSLEALIREETGISNGPIYPDNLTGIVTLDGQSRRIAKLEGLEHCVNLRTLRLGLNRIQDIGPISGLRGLEELALHENRIEDLAPLAQLTQLEIIYLNDNRIQDITPLLGNLGLGEGDLLQIGHNPLTPESRIALLELVSRGVRTPDTELLNQTN